MGFLFLPSNIFFMRQLYTILVLFLFIFSGCKKPEPQVMIVKGNIKGLTKGTLLLEKVRDTNTVIVDSYKVRKDGNFEMKDSITSPEMYYLRIKEFPADYILFFGEEGVITVNSHVEKFAYRAKVSGSKNQVLWEEYKKMNSKFNDERLTLIKRNFEADKEQNQTRLDSIDKAFKGLLKRKYLFTANYAVKNADKEIAPYLALTELSDANDFLLDTIQKSMTENIKKSSYGKQFETFLQNRRELLKDSIR